MRCLESMAKAERKAADKAHRERVESEVLADIVTGLNAGGARPLLDAMKSGKVRHVTINY